MFVNEALKTHFETQATISLESLVLAEWNMNMPDNIFKVGNYRYRPTTPGSTYYTLPIIFDPLDFGNYYTGATDADVVIDGGVNSSDIPQKFTLIKDKMKMLYSLEDCLKPFRPRSGINKPLYFNSKFLPNSGRSIAERPRFYMSSRDDVFRYWTSYRTEDNLERGIASNIENGLYYIDDAVPFVVYKEKVPANKIVLKMQTNIGSIDLGPFTTSTGTIDDPLYGESNKTTPSRWKIQYLQNNNWIDGYSFTENDTRQDGSPIISSDGYVEIQYGLIVPPEYHDIFIFAERLASSNLLPEKSLFGYSYLVIENSGDVGTYYIWTGDQYETFTPTYGWTLGNEDITNLSSFVTDLTSPDYFINNVNGETVYREFEYISGIRVVVDTMNKFDSTFDLIEISPRLAVNVTDKVVDFRITKPMSDIGITSLPVGQLLASTGQITLFDDDQAFNPNNSNSIVKNYVRKNIKFNFYENIKNVVNEDGMLYNYYVPIKTLYTEGFPQADATGATISISLRDFYFYLESIQAPRMLVTQASLSYAVSLILDYVGFTNYTFKRIGIENEPIIPFFFISPDQSVAEVLSQLAISTQSSMFFDEYNNFVVMSKEYLLPSENDRATDFVLIGNSNQEDNGVYSNEITGNQPSILSISSQDRKVYNSGQINYTERYIQRSYGSIRQSGLVDAEKTWIYQPAMLWEVAGSETTKTINQQVEKQSNYVLGAMPINSDLSADIPSVVNNQVINNIIDIGENIYWLTRYQGYLYANGEIIKYDAAEFNVTGTGNVWINSNQEYQKYFASIPFNGKIYPTGLLRIYSEPFYETIDGIERLQDGPVFQHGRGQFGTPIVYHNAGLSSYWYDNQYVRGCDMESQYLFSTAVNLDFNISGASSSGTTLNLPDIAGIDIGQTVSVVSGTGLYPSDTKVTAINTLKDTTTNLYSITVSASPNTPLVDATVNFTIIPKTQIGAAGINNTLARQTSRTGIIKNFMATSYLSESDVNNLKTTQAGTIQSSALVMTGPSFKTTETPLKFVSYVYKKLTAGSQSSDYVSPTSTKYVHFGTRLRIIGKIENNESRVQTPIGSTTYYQVQGSSPSQNTSIGGGSGGIAIMLNPETNVGYYFELAALTEDNVESYLNLDQAGTSNINLNNIVFYKVKKEVGSSNAIPIKLWGGLTSVIVDDGRFTGQYRMAGEEKPTVYDLAVEYEDLGAIRRFYLYLNNKLIKIVDDSDPLPIYDSIALFTRGSSRLMFENVYALAENYSQNTVFTVGETLSSAFDDSQIDANESFRKYALSGIIQGTYLSGIGTQQPPKYNIYFEEFGTIMRECSYFNIRYDRAYPALYATISPTLNRIKGYTISGFQADSYGAEFLVFNATDKALSLDETTGNYLRIQGITFTQDTTYELTVDDYFQKRSNLSDPEFSGSSLTYSPLVEKAKYNDIKLSRLTYGKNEFSLATPYIQTQDDANQLMGWLIDKIMVPKKSIGINMFATPILQLGDIVTIQYKNTDNVDMVANENSRFVVYNIEYSRSVEGPSMIVYLSEV